MPEPGSGRPRAATSVREAHLLRLARDVEADDPVLACELRGIAQHEAAMAMPAVEPRGASLWQRLAARWTPAPGWR